MSQTTRRSTRRPQNFNVTSTPSAAASSSAPATSPFTHAPRAPLGAHQPPYPYSGYPGFPPPNSSQATPAGSPPAPDEAMASADVSDPMDAAQQILKAINLDRLLKLNSSETQEKAGGEESRASVDNIVSNLRDDSNAMHGLESGLLDGLDDKDRAALQAQLVLLAVQLTELAHEAQTQSEGVTAGDDKVPVPEVGVSEGLVGEEEEEEEDDDDMEEAIIPVIHS